MSEQDIISIDDEVKAGFRSEENKLAEYKDKLLDIERTLEIDSLSKRTIEGLTKSHSILLSRIKDIETRRTESFYISESIEHIEKYKKILKTPIKMSFLGKKTEDNLGKKDIISDYLDIASKYSPTLSGIHSKDIPKIVCNNCNNKKSFDIVENSTYICVECGSQQEVFLYTSSYKDADRVNISAKYTYDRKIHFRDCINQYQGKQNSTIDPKVYTDLEREFENHYLLVGNETTKKEIRFQNIKKDHILMFLKELQYTKHYENVNLIYYNLTGTSPDDISYIEDKLLDDFDILTELYDKRFKYEKKIERKNFINTQYVLYQLLNRHKHPCKKEDFNILKTVDRKSFHDDICIELFTELGWNFNPHF